MAISIVNAGSGVTGPDQPTTSAATGQPVASGGGSGGGDGPAAVYTPSDPPPQSVTYGGLRAGNNLASLTAQNNLERTSSTLSNSLERLSSGLKINRGADGPAALVISEQQRAQIGGLRAALDNTNKAVSLVQTGEGALNEINVLLTRARNLALDSAHDETHDQQVLDANAEEIKNILSTIDNIASTTAFATVKLLDGSLNQTFQIGANAGQVATLTLGGATVEDLGLASFAAPAAPAADGEPAPSADDLLDAVDGAIGLVASMRGVLGAFQANTLESNANNLRVSLENTMAAESVIRDTDFASEIAAFTRSQVQLQAGSSVLGNANQIPSLVASLLRG